jgi:hypothetical protein
MGAGNVALVYASAKCQALPHHAFRLLGYMALVAKDADHPPRYWGGREPLVRALGANGTDAARARAVDRALTALKGAGVVELIARPRTGRQAEYALWISGREDHAKRGAVDAEEAGEDHAQRGPVHHAQRGPVHHAQRGFVDHAQRGPEDEYRKTQEHDQEEGSPESSRHVELWTPTASTRSIDRPSTTDRRVAAGLELAARYEAEETGTTPPQPRVGSTAPRCVHGRLRVVDGTGCHQCQTGEWPP